MRATALIALGLLATSVAFAAGDDAWPQFRGPNGSATSTNKELPEEWSGDKNIAWKAKLPGYGWSSPIVWGDKVFVTTAVTDKQQKPSGMFGPGEFGGGRGGPGGPGRGGPGGFRGGPPQPGQILPPFLQEMLRLTAEEKKEIESLQKDVDGKLGKILTDEQQKQRLAVRGGFGGMAPPGQILPTSQQDRLKLTADQKKQVDELQKEVDDRLAKVFTADQQKQFKGMREMAGRGGRGGPGGFGGQRPPDVVYKMEVYCLNAATGDVLWKQTAYEGKPRIPTQPSNTYASETPVTDGARIFAYFGMHGVYCYDFTGNLVWKVDLGSHPMAMGFGTGSSPALADGRLFIQCDNEEKSFLVALDTKTGKEHWRVPRVERTGYSTPLVWKNKVRTEVVCIGSPYVRSYDPATGKQLWELGSMAGQPKASAVSTPEFLYVGTGSGPDGFGGPGGGGGRGGFSGPGGPGGGPPGGAWGDFGPPGGPGGGPPGGAGGGFGAGGSRPFYAVKAGASGDITLKAGAKSNEGVAWQLPQAGPQTASPLLYEGYIYIPEERGGLLGCYDAHTGNQVYKERIPGARGFTSSPWAGDGKVFCLDDAGTTHIIQAGPTFKVLGKNTISEMCWSSPALVGGSLFLRTVDHLYAITRKGVEE